MKKPVYIFIGPPGSGKGTLSDLCVKQLGWTQLSTGNLCRKHISEQTEIGKQIDFAIKSGKLIPDSLITSMVVDWLETAVGSSRAVILDGYPRTVPQAEAFHEHISHRFDNVALQIVKFHVAHETVVSRLGARYICGNKSCQAVYSVGLGSDLAPKTGLLKCDACSTELTRRKDDEPTTVIERLNIYHKHERDLLEYYKQINFSPIECNAEHTVDIVFDVFLNLVGYTKS